MISRLLGDRRGMTLLRRIDRPLVIALAVAQALVAAVGWFAPPLWLAVAVAGQLALGGVGAVRVLGPARTELGLARYAMPASAGIAATLYGRLIPGGVSLLLVPIVAVGLWAVIYLELRFERGTGGRTIGVLLVTAIVFAGTAGIMALFGMRTWPPPLLLVLVLALPLAVRSAETRGALGGEAFGQSLLHLLVVAQVGTAALLLTLPLTAFAALIALAFYTWAGAVEGLRRESSGRGVALEFGVLTMIGLVVALLVHRP